MKAVYKIEFSKHKQLSSCIERIVKAKTFCFTCSPRTFGVMQIPHYVDDIILQDRDSPYTFGTAKDGSVLNGRSIPRDLKGTRQELQAVDGPMPNVMCNREVVVSANRIANVESGVPYSITEDKIHLFATRKRPDKSIQTACSHPSDHPRCHQRHQPHERRETKIRMLILIHDITANHMEPSQRQRALDCYKPYKAKI